MRIEDNSTVFIVDDDYAIRESLSDLMDSAGLKTQIFASAEEFLDGWDPKMSGCLLLDVRLPGMSGMEMQSALFQSGIAIPIIIMTAHGDMPMVRRAMKAGAVEFLIKPFNDEELLQAVEQAFELDRAHRRAGDQVRSIQDRTETLNERERQVMALVTAGLTNKEVADKLHLSVVTIKLYRGQMMKKMKAETLADLVKMYEKINPSGEPKAS
ncbi:MAG: response regulator [Terracidiphilus sp.]